MIFLKTYLQLEMASSEDSVYMSENSPLFLSASVPENHGSCREIDDCNAVAFANDAENGDAESIHCEFVKDVVDTIHLALPIFISRVSYVGVSSTICVCSQLFTLSQVYILFSSIN